MLCGGDAGCIRGVVFAVAAHHVFFATRAHTMAGRGVQREGALTGARAVLPDATPRALVLVLLLVLLVIGVLGGA